MIPAYSRLRSSMPTHQVNLDALIRRQPFDSASDGSVLGHDPLFKLEELHHSKMYFRLLRKPDFQRETANWPPAMILDFVRTFGQWIDSLNYHLALQRYKQCLCYRRRSSRERVDCMGK